MSRVNITKFFNAVVVIYYNLNIPPERVREVFPYAFEFKNPSSESFGIISPPENPKEGLLIIDVESQGERYLFVEKTGEGIILIDNLSPRVFVVPKKKLELLFKFLAGEKGLNRIEKEVRKGKPWRFLIDFIATFAVITAGDYFHLGIWGVALLGAVVITVEHLFGSKKSKTGIKELDKKIVEEIIKTSEKKGLVRRIAI
ncbi:hypothetical protein [Thermococcus sp.]